MPISNSYPKGVPIEDQDLFVGTKAANNRTVNYTAQGVADYLNINSKVAIGGQMSFQFSISPNVPKTISFEGGLGDGTAFSAITKLIVSAIDLSTADITIFLNYLNNSQVLLSQQNQPNNFGHYKITGYTQIGTSAFYELDLEFIGGNGTIGDKQYYDLVSFVLSTEVTTPTLQEVTDAGNITTNSIIVEDNTIVIKDNYDNTYFEINGYELIGKDLTTNAPYFQLGYDGQMYAYDTATVLYIQSLRFNTNGTPLQDYEFPSKPAGTYTIATTDDIPAYTTPTLQQVTDEGNETTNDIVLNSTVGEYDGYTAQNTIRNTGSTLTYLGGTPDGDFYANYDVQSFYLQRESGSYSSLVSGTNGILQVGSNDTSNANNIGVATLYSTDGAGSPYLQLYNKIAKSGYFKVTNITENITLQFPNKAAGTYTIATTSDITTPTLQQVTDEGADSYGNTINLKNSSISDSLIQFNIDDFYEPYIKVENAGAGSAGYSTILGSSTIEFEGNGDYNTIIEAGVGLNNTVTLPSGTGTLALTSDIPITSGIPHATATGTDTYTATVTGVASYADGDAYLIRFTNGNTSSATLNINSLGAIPLYRNNDGVLIGGDIISGGEMLCVYNSTTNRFQVIGTAPNSLFSYVTNDDSVTLTKGMPVYAFGGTGDRMTVKRAYNTGDATSAQTVGLVLSTSIAANQKGLIMVQGLLDGLSILPTATWSDGDPVYLGATAGTITNVKPYAPNHLVYLGVVTTASNGAAGRMYVRVQNGYELQELHNVQAQSPSLNDTLWYDNTVSPAQWKTASIPTILGYTPPDLGLVQAMTQGLQNIF